LIELPINGVRKAESEHIARSFQRLLVVPMGGGPLLLAYGGIGGIVD
jgi:hypothetical protein